MAAVVADVAGEMASVSASMIADTGESGVAGAGMARSAGPGAFVAGAGVAGAGTAVEVGGELAELEPPPPPPQATSVVPNAAIAAIRIAKVWRVMADLQKLLWGTNYCPVEFLKVTPKQNSITAKSVLLFRISSKYNTTLSISLRILFVLKAIIVYLYCYFSVFTQ